jgi:hypothetical protein
MKAGVDTQTVTIVKHGVTFSMPGAAGASVLDIVQVMTNANVKSAIAASFADGLGLTENYVTISKVGVEQARRRLDGLQEAATLADSTPPRTRRLSSFSVSVEYHAEVPNTGSHTSGAIANDMKSMGDTSSSANQQFTKSFASNLQAAAAQNPDIIVLTSIAQSVQINGITVTGVLEPAVFTVVVPRTTTTIRLQGQSGEDSTDDNSNLVVNIIAAILGVLAAGSCGLAGWYLIVRNNNQSRVTPMSDDIDADTPEASRASGDHLLNRKSLQELPSEFIGGGWRVPEPPETDTQELAAQSKEVPDLPPMSADLLLAACQPGPSCQAAGSGDEAPQLPVISAEQLLQASTGDADEPSTLPGMSAQLLLDACNKPAGNQSEMPSQLDASDRHVTLS